MTTLTIPDVEPTSAPAPAATGAGFRTTALGTAKRTVLQFFRTPQLLMMGTIQGALFLFMFRYVFGGAISTGGSISYVDFLVPGFLVTTVLGVIIGFRTHGSVGAVALAFALIGWLAANGCIQPGIESTGTLALETNENGITSIDMPWAAWAFFDASPMKMKTHVQLKP